MEEFQCNQCATRWLLITLGNGALSRDSAGLCCWADKGLSNSIGQLSFGKGKSMLWSPWLASIPAMTILFKAHWVSTYNPQCLGERLFAIHRTCHFVHLINKSLLCREPPLVSIHIDTNIFAVCVLSEKTIDIPLLHTPLSLIFQSASFPNHPTTLLATTHELV